MKTFKSLMVAAVAISAAAAPVLAQTPRPTTPAATEEAAKAAPKSLAGELVAFDQTARTATVKHMVDKKPVQVTWTGSATAAAARETLIEASRPGLSKTGGAVADSR